MMATQLDWFKNSCQLDWTTNRQIQHQHNLEAYHNHTTNTITVSRLYPMEQIRVNVEIWGYNVPLIEEVSDWLDRKRTHSPDYVNPGPTNRELSHPTVSAAWDEFQLIYRLSIQKSRY